MQIQSGFEPMTPIAHMKNKKILEKREFELQISGRESKTLPLDHYVIAERKVLKYWRNQSISPAALLVFLSFLVPNHSLFAIFSQFPPFSAIYHLYYTYTYLFWQLLPFIKFPEAERGSLKNKLPGVYFLNPCTNQKNPCIGSIDFL